MSLRLNSIVGVVLLLFVVAGCDDGSGTTTDPGTGDIQGTVTLGDDAQPTGVTITAAGQSATTTADGAYLLSGLPSGTHLLRASLNGYTPFEEDVTVVAGSAVTVDITLQRRGPRIESLTLDPTRVAPTSTSTATAVVSAPEGSTLTYNWSVTPTSFVIESTEDGSTATITAPPTPDLEGTVTLEVIDDAGTTDTTTATISTTANGAPIISSVTANPPTLTPGGTSTLRVIASDPDGDTLQYSWTAPSGWTITGEGDTVTLTAPDTPGATATITVEVSDALTLTTSEIVVGTNNNAAPSIASFTATPPSVAPGGAITLNVSANDPDGDSLLYNWSSPPEWPIEPNGATAAITAPDSYGQTGAITVSVSDSFGGTANADVTVTTVANQPPTISSLVANPSTVKPGLEITLTATASDPYGDALTYEWSVDDPDWTLSGTGATVTLTATTAKDDSAVVTVVVSDPLGATATSATSVLTNSNCSLADGLIDGGATHCFYCGTDAINADSPLFLWPLDDSGSSATDATGNGRAGTYNGSEAQGAPSVNNNGSGATLFNRTTESRVQTANATWWPTTALSATFWMRGTAPNQNAGLLSYAAGGSDNHFLLYHENNADGLNIYFGGPSVATGVDLMDGQWHHVAVTWRSSDGALQLYVDGASAFTGTLSAGTTLTAGGTFMLAQDQDNVGGGLDGSQSFSGALANVAIFDTVLTPTQISRQMRGATCEEVCDGVDNDNDGSTDEGYFGACASNAAASCKNIVDANLAQNDGIYWIDPLNTGTGVAAWCDMSTDGGGWTLAMRTRWSWSESSPLQSTYASFYGDYLGAPNPLNAHRLPAQYWSTLQSSTEHLARYTIRTTTGSSCQPLEYMITNGTWDIPAGGGATVAGYSQPITIFNSGNVSTTDNGPSPTCTGANRGASWTYGSCCSTCPTYMGSYWSDEPHPMASVSMLTDNADLNGNTATEACTGVTGLLSNNGTGSFFGLNTWEYYIR